MNKLRLGVKLLAKIWQGINSFLDSVVKLLAIVMLGSGIIAMITTIFQIQFPEKQYEYEVTLVLPSKESLGTDTVVVRVTGKNVETLTQSGFLKAGDKRYPREHIREIENLGEVKQ